MLHTVLLVGLALCSRIAGASPVITPGSQQLGNNSVLLGGPFGEIPASNIAASPFGTIGWQPRIDPYIFIGPVLSYQPVFGNGPVVAYPSIASAINGLGFGQYPVGNVAPQINVISLVNAVQPTAPPAAVTELTSAVITQNPSTTTATVSARAEPPKYPNCCAEATAISRQTGVYTIQFSGKPVQVFCEERIWGGGWIVIQRRQSNSTSFERGFAEYRRGFGNVVSDYWIGLENLHQLTTGKLPQELMVVMMDFDNNTQHANYDHFEVGSEEEGYSLNSLGQFVGNAGDSLRRHEHHEFSTKDMDKDKAKVHCAEKYAGGWWYHSCYDSNLNGRFGELEGVNGIVWNTFHRHGSLKSVQMMIRPRAPAQISDKCTLN